MKHLGFSFFTHCRLLTFLIICTPNYSCIHKSPKVEWEKGTHMLKDASGNIIREVRLIDTNSDGSIKCTKYYYKKQEVDGNSFINLDKPDTSIFKTSDILHCNFNKGKSYMAILYFLGSSDTSFIEW